MLAYIVITAGKKMAGHVAQWPQAEMQKRNLLAVARTNREGAKVDYFGDYARGASGLRSFPNLVRILSRLRDQAEGQVFIDDLRRMFRVCKKDRRRSLLEELHEYGDYLTDVRTRRRVSGLSERAKLELLYWPTGKPFRFPEASKATTPPAARQTQTQPARAASAVARVTEADKRAMAIWSIREELVAQQGRATYAEVAAEATRRGLHTAQGGAWRANNIGRALERAQGLLPEGQPKDEDAPL